MRGRLVFVGLVAAAVALASGPGAGAAVVRCPATTLPLGSNAVDAAATAALAADPARNRPKLGRAVPATRDVPRGTTARLWCGAAVWRHTVVVYITDRAFLPAQSASQHVVFVSRLPGGYRVWARVH